MSRPTETRLLGIEAICAGCDFHQAGVNALALAARHYDHTGHPVTVTIEREIRYGTIADAGRAREAAGQGTLIP